MAHNTYNQMKWICVRSFGWNHHSDQERSTVWGRLRVSYTNFFVRCNNCYWPYIFAFSINQNEKWMRGMSTFLYICIGFKFKKKGEGRNLFSVSSFSKLYGLLCFMFRSDIERVVFFSISLFAKYLLYYSVCITRFDVCSQAQRES